MVRVEYINQATLVLEIVESGNRVSVVTDDGIAIWETDDPRAAEAEFEVQLVHIGHLTNTN